MTLGVDGQVQFDRRREVDLSALEQRAACYLNESDVALRYRKQLIKARSVSGDGQ